MKTENTVWHPQHISKQQRAELKKQKPCLLWYTGLSGSGKSTVANAVVESVTIGRGGQGLALNLDGLGSWRMSDVLQIHQ